MVARREVPPAQLVRYNDWRQVELPPLREFRPESPVSVVVPYYAQLEELGRTLAALEGQRYPRELFEVVVVDDGSPEPLAEVGQALFDRAPFAVRVARQEDRGFGAARARNTGARVAAHEVLLFLDGDMLPEADWLTAHARWHHAVPDALTLGLRAHVPVDGVDAEAIRNRPGTLEELFAGRRVDRPWFESYWKKTNDLTSKADDLFRTVVSGNLGVRRGFFELVGGFDESFTAWGREDTEFGYRAFTRGGLLAPVREGFAWRQGAWAKGRATKQRRQVLAVAKVAHLIPHGHFRAGMAGRTFTVPQFVVTIRGGALPAADLLRRVDRVLGGPMHDLVVRLELPADHAGRAWLERQLGPDPRVRVAPSRPVLEEFPASPFLVTLPAERRLAEDVVPRLSAALGTAVFGRCVFPDGSRASIVRAWALHRARRTRWEVSDFGEVVTIPPGRLAPARVRAGGRQAGPVVGKTVSTPRPEYPLGVEIAAVGPRSARVFAASPRVARTLVGQHVDVVLADTAAEAAGVAAPVVVLAEAPPQLSVPAFDPWVHNPIGWFDGERKRVGALGPRDRLPEGCEADREVGADDRAALRKLCYLEDVAAFHRDPVARAGELVRLAATGVVVHLADGDRRLAPYLGAELFALMTSDVGSLGDAGREELGVRMRRAALREHSLGSRARQVAERVLPDPPWLPLVSVVVATRRPGFLGRVLATVREQTYPRLELILGLHGEGFGRWGPMRRGRRFR